MERKFISFWWLSFYPSPPSNPYNIYFTNKKAGPGLGSVRGGRPCSHTGGERIELFWKIGQLFIEKWSPVIDWGIYNTKTFSFICYTLFKHFKLMEHSQILTLRLKINAIQKYNLLSFSVFGHTSLFYYKSYPQHLVWSEVCFDLMGISESSSNITYKWQKYTLMMKM